MTAVTLNLEQRLFVLDHGTGFTCLGFDVAFRRLRMYAQKLGMAQPDTKDIGTLSQYAAYAAAEQAFARTNPRETVFDPDTAPMVSALLDAYIKTSARVRLFFGDVKTGRDWLEEHDVIGTVGRTMGPLKSPILLSSPSASGGGIISTACILRIVDVASKEELYRHRLYQTPRFDVRPCTGVRGYTTEVHANGALHARFKSAAAAQNWMAFMRGERMKP